MVFESVVTILQNMWFSHGGEGAKWKKMAGYRATKHNKTQNKQNVSFDLGNLAVVVQLVKGNYLGLI